MKPRILFLVPADYDALRKKGVDRMIEERDEGGYFERVVTVHPLAPQRRIIDLNPVHRIYELGIGHGAAAPFRALMAFAALTRIARDERVDLVRANDPYLMGLMGWWVARRLQVPLCVSIHTDYRQAFALNPKDFLGRWRRRMASWLPPFVLRRANMVLPIREHLVPALVEAGARPDAIHVVPHGIDMRPFDSPPAHDVRAACDVPHDRQVISIACRLSAENYVGDLAAVMARIAAVRIDVMFVIFGEGPEERVLRDLLEQQPSIAGSVRWLPFQSRDQVIALRQASDVSLCLMGGFSLIEACAAGSPVIAYDVAWHHELIRSGETGCLVREHDVDGVVAAVTRLLDDPAAAKALGARGRQLARDRHTLAHTSSIKRRWYTELLAREAARA